MRSGSGYLEGLANAGLRPEDVDIVLCTHLHADHIGWNTRLDNGRWVPTFPKARYLTGGKDLAFFRAQEQANPGVSNHGSFSDSVLPVEEAGQMETVEDGFDLGRGLSIVGLPGHSPGQVGLDLLFGAGEHVIFCGDAIHSPVQVYKPEWATRFCADAGTAVTTRMALMEQSADDGAMLLPSHLRNAMAMRIRRCNRGFEPILI
jgi:glyoxylase-like metal-dependent hydrolase (beta-lactamase superfamily II)